MGVDKIFSQLLPVVNVVEIIDDVYHDVVHLNSRTEKIYPAGLLSRDMDNIHERDSFRQARLLYKLEA